MVAWPGGPEATDASRVRFWPWIRACRSPETKAKLNPRGCPPWAPAEPAPAEVFGQRSFLKFI